jgi:inorganic pyrophosphatase
MLNYGFIPGTISPDGEELDAYVIGVDVPIQTFTGKCIAVIHRTNDDDDKLVVVPDGVELSDDEIRKATDFQEQYFKSEIIR